MCFLQNIAGFSELASKTAVQLTLLAMSCSSLVSVCSAETLWIMAVWHHGIQRDVRRMQVGCTMHAERSASPGPILRILMKKGFGRNSNVDCLGLAIGSQND